MEKVLIVGCQQTMNEICVGCSRCMVAFNRREGEFAAYGPDAQLIGLLSCGGCPGQAIVMRLAQMKLWNAPMQEMPTHLHVAPCLDLHCPHAEIIKQKIVKTAGIPVILGAHPYLPKDIFAV
ncbi:Predicted metal-binding protein [Paucidesulfovibrio gracilis DSM 16080]|uniref:Predicted metal-binding protein n=1 Tax=Paucidesulfovibrio gracilis DSM 16080 TaxID=1121449 RepID=A0A1T4WKW7_9BACT|nr:CGGC domain-containing protein [Paucidesulfovibrio gracilis]SKA77548.1 Predicted metal-binding protein [Paucidesulfovibrio gracilis DSM 16080]